MSPHDEHEDDAVPAEAAAPPAEDAPPPADDVAAAGTPVPGPAEPPVAEDVPPAAEGVDPAPAAADEAPGDVPAAVDEGDRDASAEDTVPGADGSPAPAEPVAGPSGPVEPVEQVSGDDEGAAQAPEDAVPTGPDAAPGPVTGADAAQESAEPEPAPSAEPEVAAELAAEAGPPAAAEVPDTAPEQPVEDPAPAEPAGDLATAEPVDAVPLVDAVQAVEPVDQAPAVEPVVVVPAAEPLDAVPAAEPLDAVPAVEPVVVVPVVEPVVVVSAVEPVDQAPAAEPVDEVPAAAEPAPWEDAQPVEPAPSADSLSGEPAPWAVAATPVAEPGAGDVVPPADPAPEDRTATGAAAPDTWSPPAEPAWPGLETPPPPVTPTPAPPRRPRPGPAAPVDRPGEGASGTAAPRRAPAPRPSPRPRPAAPVAPARSAARPSPSPSGQAPRRPPRGASAAVPARRRRVWPVLLAAVLAVALLAAGALWFLERRADPGGAATAEQVPDAVLPELAAPAPALAELSADAPVPSPAVLDAVLSPLLAAPALGTGLSAQVVDVATGDVLFDRASADPGTPASTAKLLTALAALTTLDPESTLTTRVVSGSAPGEVVLVGGGDPTLSTTDPSVAYPGAATVAELAAQVQAQVGGTAVSRVVVDGSLFSGPLTAPGWGPDDAPSSYAAPVTAIAVDGARVDPRGTQRSGQPGTDAGTALAAALGVPTAEVVLGTAPAAARELGSVESASVQRLVEESLTQSDNLLAESLARHVALARGLPATFAGSAQAVSEAVAETGVDTTGLSLVDASGLSEQDRAPARLLADVVRAVSDGTIPEAAGLLAGLPVAGYTGTLAERTADGAGPGSVRAKTGTLLAVHDLAGTVVTADGRLLAFAVLADATASSPVASETALDVVAAALAACGCR
ncbi:D-alanyl-D-alanine carboxypeptidase/D-alanyl-D-alanine endopeptidase [Modestobacter sp. URMC 112]